MLLQEICTHLLHISHYTALNDCLQQFFHRYYQEISYWHTFLSWSKRCERKKDEIFGKNNYRPVSILSSVSKTYGRCIYDQINDYFHPLFSKLQCGFRKEFNAQHGLLVLVEKCREVLDKRGYTGILLTDLSKAFYCINHELLIARLHPYGFSLESLTFI